MSGKSELANIVGQSRHHSDADAMPDAFPICLVAYVLEYTVAEDAEIA